MGNFEIAEAATSSVKKVVLKIFASFPGKHSGVTEGVYGVRSHRVREKACPF